MIIDILFFLGLGCGFYWGYKFMPLTSVVTYLPYALGGLLAIYLTPPLYDKIASSWGSDSILILLLLFLLIFWLCKSFVVFLTESLYKGQKKAGIKQPQRVLQGITMSFLCVLVTSLLLMFGIKSTLLNDTSKNNSITYPLAVALPTKTASMLKRLKPGVKTFVDKTNDVIEKK